MSLKTKRRYKMDNQTILRIKRKRGPFGIEEHFEDITGLELFPQGWAIVRNESSEKGIFHYFEKNKQHSFCHLGISDIPKKRIYIDPKTYKSQKYHPCFYCTKQLTQWKKTGIHPDESRKKPGVLPQKLKNKPKSKPIKLKQFGEWVSTICPKCHKQKVFWNGKKNQDEHYCDTCQTIVIIPSSFEF